MSMFRAVIILISAFLLQPLVWAAPLYKVHALVDPTRPDWTFTPNFRLYNRFDSDSNPGILGSVSVPNGGALAAIGELQNGVFSFTTFEPLAGDTGSYVLKVLNDGSAFGSSFGGSGNSYVRWINGVPQPLVIQNPNNPNVLLNPILANESGVVTGSQIDFNANTLSIFQFNLFTQEFKILPNPPQALQNSFFQFYDMNSAGQLLIEAEEFGTPQMPGPIPVWYRWEPGTNSWTRLGAPGDGYQKLGLAYMNDSGDTVGFMIKDSPPSDLAAFTYRNGIWSPALNPAPGGNPNGPGCGLQLYDIANDGRLLMCYQGKASLVENGQLIELWPLVVNATGWNSQSALSNPFATLTGIDDQERIIGVEEYNGTLTAFLMEPIPEPGTFALGCIGLFGIWRLRRSNAHSA